MLGVQGCQVLVKQVVRIGVEALGSTNLQSFCKIDVQFWMLALKPIPLEIPMHPFQIVVGQV
jgi:hypothetical protein